MHQVALRGVEHGIMLSCIVCCSQVVAPKKIKLAEAEASLAVQMEKLNAKRAELQGVSPHSCIVEDRDSLTDQPYTCTNYIKCLCALTSQVG